MASRRLLALTGCRRSEILGLRWEHAALEAGELRLPDSKTRARVLPLPPQAVELLTSLPRIPGNPWAIPGRKPGTHLRNIDEAWRAIRERAGLGSVRIHDLRHSYASHALALVGKRQNTAFMTPGESADGNRIDLLKQTPEKPAAESARTGVAESIAEDLL